MAVLSIIKWRLPWAISLPLFWMQAVMVWFAVNGPSSTGWLMALSSTSCVLGVLPWPKMARKEGDP